MVDTLKRNGTVPPAGERTGAQQVAGRIGIATFAGEVVLGPMWPGSFDTYRMMRANPTIAIARAAAFMPFQLLPWTFEAEDDAPEGAVELVQGTFERLKTQFVADLFGALDYGFQAFEKVWELDREGLFTFKKLKPLAPDWVSPLMDAATGALVGASTGQANLGLDKVAWITYDAEFGDPFGRSRHENVRRYAWKPWCDIARKLEIYTQKAAGVVPIVHYPVGTSDDANGQTKDNSEIAATLLNALGKTYGVTIPTKLEQWAEDMLRSAQAGANLKDLLAWRVEFLTAASGHGSEMLDVLKHFESLMMRGWLTPERAVLEGSHGNRAEAETHGDTGDAINAGALTGLVAQVNVQCVDDLLAVNFGDRAKGTVRIKIGSLSDADKRFFREIFRVLLTSPATVDLLTEIADVDAMADAAGIPKAREVIEIEDRPARGEPVPPGAAGDTKLIGEVMDDEGEDADSDSAT